MEESNSKREVFLAEVKHCIGDLLHLLIPFKLTEEEEKVIHPIIDRHSETVYENAVKALDKIAETSAQAVAKLKPEHQNIGEIPIKFIKPIAQAFAASLIKANVDLVSHHLQMLHQSGFGVAETHGNMLARKLVEPGRYFDHIIVNYSDWTFGLQETPQPQTQLMEQVRSLPPEARQALLASVLKRRN